jgi:hypothetical protein
MNKNPPITVKSVLTLISQFYLCREGVEGEGDCDAQGHHGSHDDQLLPLDVHGPVGVVAVQGADEAHHISFFQGM